MPKADIGPKIGIDGEAKFKSQIKDINSSLKVLGSEMKIVTEEFGKNAKSEEALTKKNEILERKVIELKEKLDLQTQALKNQVDATSEADQHSKELQIQVNNTAAELAKAERQIRENTTALDNMGSETEDAGEEFDDAGEKAVSFGDVLKANVLGDAITKGLETLANGIKKVGKAMVDAVKDGAAYGDEMLSLSQQTGLSTDTLQEFKYMADLVDTDLSTITGALSKLTKNMASASKGTGASAEAFQKLGVNVTNADGSLRDNEDVFNDVIDALGNMTNETERDATAMDIFGKSAQELNPLITAGSDAIQGYAEEAHNMGYVLDNETLQSLGGVQDSFDKLNNLSDTIKNQLATALAPTIEDLTTKFSEWAASVDWEAVGEKIKGVVEKIQEFGNFITENGSTIISIIAGIAAGMIAWNVASAIMGVVNAIKAFQRANEGATVAQAALNVVMNANPIGIIITAVTALVTAIITLWNTNEDFRNWVKQAWEDIKNFFVNAWEGIKKAFAEVGDWFDEKFTAAFDAVTGAFDTVVEFFTGIWEDIKGVFSTVWDTFTGIGEDIVEGIKQGIKDAWDRFTSWVTGLFDGLVGGVKKLLGINSPSKVFAGIGEDMADGLAVGWDREFNAVQRDIDGSMSSLLPTSTANIGVVSSMRGTGMQSSVADAVNAMGTLMSGNGNGGDLAIQFIINGREFARGILPDFRLVSAQNPIIVNDF